MWFNQHQHQHQFSFCHWRERLCSQSSWCSQPGPSPTGVISTSWTTTTSHLMRFCCFVCEMLFVFSAASIPPSQLARPLMGGEGCLGPVLREAVGAACPPHCSTSRATWAHCHQPDCWPTNFNQRKKVRALRWWRFLTKGGGKRDLENTPQIYPVDCILAQRSC